MKLGLAYCNAGPLVLPESAAALAEAADEYGIESIWTVEHVVVPADFESPYPYSKTGEMPGGEDIPISDPLVWLAWVAAKSERVKLATGVLILPERNPVVLAKETATLDLLSGGRLILGIGVGWLKEEFDAIGVPFEGRGARTDEYIEALRALWTEDEPTYSGETVAFSRAKCYPKPAQPSVPVVVGGHSKAAARRAGRLGDGFFPNHKSQNAELIQLMRETASDAGRDPNAIEITAAAKPEADWFKMARDELGVSRTLMPVPGFTPDTIRPGLEQLTNLVASLS